MTFQGSKHLFDPHLPPVALQGHLSVGQVRRSAPGLRFTLLPVGQQVDLINLLLAQVPVPQPAALPGFVRETAKIRSTLLLSHQVSLLSSSAVPLDMPNPGPGNQDGSFAVGQSDYQQPVLKPNFGADEMRSQMLAPEKAGILALRCWLCQLAVNSLSSPKDPSVF